MAKDKTPIVAAVPLAWSIDRLLASASTYAGAVDEVLVAVSRARRTWRGEKYLGLGPGWDRDLAAGLASCGCHTLRVVEYDLAAFSGTPTQGDADPRTRDLLSVCALPGAAVLEVDADETVDGLDVLVDWTRRQARAAESVQFRCCMATVLKVDGDLALLATDGAPTWPVGHYPAPAAHTTSRCVAARSTVQAPAAVRLVNWAWVGSELHIEEKVFGNAQDYLGRRPREFVEWWRALDVTRPEATALWPYGDGRRWTRFEAVEWASLPGGVAMMEAHENDY